MNTGNLLSIIVAALAILGAGGSAVAFLADRGNKQRLTDLDADIARRDKRIDFLDEENTRKDKIIADQSQDMALMHGEVTSLKEYRDAQAGPLLTITQQLAQLHDLVKAHHETARTGIAVLEAQGADALRLLGDRRTVMAESITNEVGKQIKGEQP